MSNNCKRNPNPAPLAAIPLPPRKSRHGRTIVGSPAKGADDQRPSPYVKHWRTLELNTTTNEYEVTFHKRPMTDEEVQLERSKVLRASKSTNTYGKPQNPKGSTGTKQPRGATPAGTRSGGRS